MTAPVFPVVDAERVTPLPLEQRGYYDFYRTPRWRGWKPILGLLMGAFFALIAMTVPAVIGMLIDHVDFVEVGKTGKIPAGPGMFIGNNIGLALCIPVAMLTQWAIFGQRPRWMSSVQGRFRWGWFGRTLLVVLPLWIILQVVQYLMGGLPELSWKPYSLVMIIGILVTTPFQCAGEEYLVRGLEQRLIGSYFSNRWVGWVVATILGSATFMGLHAAQDPWLNVFYFSMGVVSSWVAWKTGGLEASVAIHVVNNLLAEMFMPFTDFSDMFDREKGQGDPSVLIIVAALVLVAVALTWMAKRDAVVTQTAPGAEIVAQAQSESDAWHAQAWGMLPAQPWGQPGAAIEPASLNPWDQATQSGSAAQDQPWNQASGRPTDDTPVSPADGTQDPLSDPEESDMTQEPPRP